MLAAIAQRDAALERANHFRTVQRIFKENVAECPPETGLLLVREIITDPPTELAGLRVEKALMAVHTIGMHRAAAILRKAHISPQRRLRDLTDNELARLAAVLR